MDNPWKEVSLDDYEHHMALANVYQLQTLDRIMSEQFSAHAVESVAVLGVAGGNGLGNLINIPAVKQIYGIDINPSYLKASAERYPQLAERYRTVLADINTDCSKLPEAELVVANLFIEYVGYDNFAHAVECIGPKYESCVIQIDPAEDFVSDSPYTSHLGILDRIHNSVNSTALTSALNRKGYVLVRTTSTELPNRKIFKRLDFERLSEGNGTQLGLDSCGC